MTSKLTVSRYVRTAMMVLAPVAGAAAAWWLESGCCGDFEPVEPRELLARRIPNVELTTHEGEVVRFYDDLIKDKKVVLNFIYKRCTGICVPVTRNLVRVQELLGDRVGKDIFFYSVTLDPERDSPEELAEYAADMGVGPGWRFLTGSAEDCELIRRSLGFVDPDPVVDADRTNHAGNVLFGYEPLMLWAACPGELDAEALVVSILRQIDFADGPQKASQTAIGGDR